MPNVPFGLIIPRTTLGLHTLMVGNCQTVACVFVLFLALADSDLPAQVTSQLNDTVTRTTRAALSEIDSGQRIRLDAFPQIPRHSAHQMSFEHSRHPLPPDLGPIPVAATKSARTGGFIPRPRWQGVAHGLSRSSKSIASLGTYQNVRVAAIHRAAPAIPVTSASKDRPWDEKKQPVQVNVELLRQRVDSHNLSVAAIEDQLDTLPARNLDKLESVFTQVEELLDRRKTWLIYLRAVSEEQRKRIGTVASTDQLLAELEDKVFHAQLTAISTVSAEDAARIRSMSKRVTAWTK